LQKLPIGIFLNRSSVVSPPNPEFRSLAEDAVEAAFEDPDWNAERAAGRIKRPLRHNGMPYRGINVLVLWVEQCVRACGFACPVRNNIALVEAS